MKQNVESNKRTTTTTTNTREEKKNTELYVDLILHCPSNRTRMLREYRPTNRPSICLFATTTTKESENQKRKKENELIFSSSLFNQDERLSEVLNEHFINDALLNGIEQNHIKQFSLKFT